MRFFTLFFIFIVVNLNAQQLTQTVRGNVVDVDTKEQLYGTTVLVLSDTIETLGSTSDDHGNFRIDKIPLGHQTLRFSFIGYKDLIQQIVVTSAKEIVLSVELEESVIEINTVEVTATRYDGSVVNEMATVSARAFSVEETDRYAGSRGDPARMASNYAGVQGADDSRNDIVIRGNTPMGLIYYFEGIDLPNPNHFAIAGSAGGPVSILNNNILSNSDFYTGAFPAEFGNSIAGVFDLKLKAGNNEKHEFSGQFGFLGTEIFAEGPLSKNHRSSYLVSYRYSTLALFKSAGIQIGTDAVPKYQDGAFNLNFPLKKGGDFKIFGIGGKSGISILIHEQLKPNPDLYGQDDRDQYFNTGMGVIGTSFSSKTGEKSFLKITIAASGEIQNAVHDYIVRHTNSLGEYVVDSLYPVLGYTFKKSKYSGSVSYNYKPNKKNIVKIGLLSDVMSYNLIDSTFIASNTAWKRRWDTKTSAILLQPYAQLKHKFTDDLSIVIGLHAQYFSLNRSLSAFEPRAGMKWSSGKNIFTLGWGIHSQLPPDYIYFYYKQLDSFGNPILHNHDMGFIKSNHYIFGYEWYPKSNFRIKTEIYYQNLYKIPIEVKSSSFSLINQGSGFSRFFPDSLENKGNGTNYGIELTIERFFSKKFYFLFTASYYSSTYSGSDGVTRNTDFNGKYALNGLVGYEISLGKNSSLGLGAKITAAGGKLTGLVDITSSALQNELVYVDSSYNSAYLPGYFRTDIKINFKINRKKVTHEVALDIVNLLNHKNILGLTYAPNPNDPTAYPVAKNYQLGFLPIFYYKIDF